MEAYAPVKTARSWDSFRVPLIKVLNTLKPTTVFEYAPGESTKIIQAHESCTLIDTLEHDEAWAYKIKPHLNHKVEIYCESEGDLYPYVQGRLDRYDLIFVDGIKRIECLGVARFRVNKHGVVILHDAERTEYKKMIDSYSFKFFVDEGHTVILTNSQDTAIKLSEALWE